MPGKRVPFLDLKLQYRLHKAEFDTALEEVVASAAFIEGPAVREFEEAFAAYCGTREAVALDSGTVAIQLSLLALGIGSGDEVIVPTHTFIATAAAVAVTGAKPVFVDSDPTTWQMDMNQVEARITPRTRAVIPVHLYGNPADMDALMEISNRRGIEVVEDACQAHGARIGALRAGSLGRTGCFSFYPGKNLGAFGDGGATVTDDPVIAERLRRLRNHGRVSKYEHCEVGFNFRMDTLQAAVLNVKLPHLDAWNEKRRVVAAAYRKSLAPLPVRMPTPVKGAESVHHLFPVCVPGRDQLAARLAEMGIDSGVHYPLPLHLQPAFATLGYKRGDFPVAERIAAETLSLPIFPEMTQLQVDQVCFAVGQWAEDCVARAAAER